MGVLQLKLNLFLSIRSSQTTLMVFGSNLLLLNSLKWKILSTKKLLLRFLNLLKQSLMKPLLQLLKHSKLGLKYTAKFSYYRSNFIRLLFDLLFLLRCLFLLDNDTCLLTKTEFARTLIKLLQLLPKKMERHSQMPREMSSEDLKSSSIFAVKQEQK